MAGTAETAVSSIPETDGGPPRIGKGPSGNKGAKDPERRCIATMESHPQSRMIRFALSSDKEVTPDLAARLPGRGAWVQSTREAVDLAAKRGAFARAFKAQVKVAPGLGDLVDKLLAARALEQLGLVRRAGDLILGFEQVREAIREARPACVIEASDGAADGRGGVLGLLKGVYGPDRDEDGDEPEPSAGLAPEQDKQAKNRGLPPVVGCFKADELGMALGRERVIHACLKQGRFSTSWTGELARLSGFRRVWLEGWQPAADTTRSAPPTPHLSGETIPPPQAGGQTNARNGDNRSE